MHVCKVVKTSSTCADSFDVPPVALDIELPVLSNNTLVVVQYAKVSFNDSGNDIHDVTEKTVLVRPTNRQPNLQTNHAYQIVEYLRCFAWQFQKLVQFAQQACNTTAVLLDFVYNGARIAAS